MTTLLRNNPCPEPAEPRTIARFLGRIEVRCDGIRIDARLPGQALGTLVYLLAHHGDTLRRDDVAFALWPDVGESDAKTALRRNLYTIAQALPVRPAPWLRCDAKTVTWDPAPATTWVDATEFEGATQSPETFEEAARLYGGDFAPKIDHEWALVIRERLQRRAKRTLEHLVERYIARHDAQTALAHCEHLLEIDPWREDALCSTMRLRYRLGDRAGAMHSYRRFRGRLHDEFGVEPMPETESCYSTISAGARM